MTHYYLERKMRNEWMNEWMNERTNEWMNEWMRTCCTYSHLMPEDVTRNSWRTRTTMKPDTACILSIVVLSTYAVTSVITPADLSLPLSLSPRLADKSSSLTSASEAIRLRHASAVVVRPTVRNQSASRGDATWEVINDWKNNRRRNNAASVEQIIASSFHRL